MKFKRHHNYTSLSDLELVSLLRKGYHAAYTEILKRYAPLLVRFAYRRLADLQLAEDLSQDVLFYIWEKRESLHIKKDFESLIFKVMKHRVLDHFRRQKVIQNYLTSTHRFLAQQQADTDHRVSTNLLQQLVDREVHALPRNMRITFELNKKNFMSPGEIAEHLAMPENSVKCNIQRATLRLKRKLYASLFPAMQTYKI